MRTVFIGLGSNEGDRLHAICRAVRFLNALPQTRVMQMAPILQTCPFGGGVQDPYLNTVVELETTHSPSDLLESVKIIERSMGRNPNGPRWGPRPIDLDILFYDQLVVAEPELYIPHLWLHERLFVLEPLAQIAPHWTHPILRQTVAQLRDRLLESQVPSSREEDFIRSRSFEPISAFLD